MRMSSNQEKETVPKPWHVFIRRSKTVAHASLPVDLILAAIGPVPLNSNHLCTDSLLSTIEPDNFGPSDLDLPIALRKSKRSPCILLQIVSYDCLTTFSPPFATSTSSVTIPKSYQEVVIYLE